MKQKRELIAAFVCFGFLITLPLIQLQVLDGWEGCYVSFNDSADLVPADCEASG